jgi:glutamate 5-kinase
VVKVGSSLLRESPAARPAAIADEIATLRASRALEIVVVSSGAIALGSRVLGLKARPQSLPHLQAAAAVGQSHLMQHWEHALSAHRIATAQVLLTHDDLGDRRRFLNARHALRALLDAGVVPVINENDTVGVEEIKYGDNDLLAALVCNLMSADALVVLTDVAGLFDRDPRQGGVRVPLVRDVDREAVAAAAGADPRGVGSGGMASKVQAAKAAAAGRRRRHPLRAIRRSNQQPQALDRLQPAPLGAGRRRRRRAPRGDHRGAKPAAGRRRGRARGV